MLDFILSLIIVVAIILVPIKIASNFVGAQNTGFLACISAILMVTAAERGIALVIPQLAETHMALQIIVTLFISGFLYMIVLGTTYINGNIMALIQLVIMSLLVFLVGTFVPGWTLYVSI